jgi:hypothetical protein
VSTQAFGAKCTEDISALVPTESVRLRVVEDFYCYEIKNLVKDNLRSADFLSGVYTLEKYIKEYGSIGSVAIWKSSVVDEMRAQGIKLEEAQQLRQNFFDRGNENQTSAKNFKEVMRSITNAVAAKKADYLVYYNDINSFSVGSAVSLQNGGVYDSKTGKMCSTSVLTYSAGDFRRAIMVVGNSIQNIFGETLFNISRDNTTFSIKSSAGDDTGIKWDNASCPISSIARDEDKNSYCWSCPLFRLMYNISSSYAIAEYEFIKPAALKLLIIGFAFWILYFTFNALNPLGKIMSPGEYGETIYKNFAVASFSAFLLTAASPTVIYEYGITPIISLGVQYSKDVLETTGVKIDLKNCRASQVKDIPLFKTENGEEKKYEQAFSDEAKNELTCLIEGFSSLQSRYMTVGKYLMQYSFNPAYSQSFFNPGMFIAGFIVMLLFATILMTFPLILLSAFFNLSIVCLMMPLLVVSWVFDYTKKYVTTAIEIVIQATLTIVFLSIISAYLVTGMQTVYTGGNKGSDAISKYITDTSKVYAQSDEEIKNIDPLEKAIENDDVKGIIDSMNFGGINLIKIVFMGFVFLVLIFKVEDIASKFKITLGDTKYFTNVAKAISDSILAKAKSATISKINQRVEKR